MLITANIEEKQAGAKELLKNIELKLSEGEIVGFVGRNGVGKTTLVKIIMGLDKDFIGTVDQQPNLIVLSTEQEQHDVSTDLATLNYVLDGLRDYRRLTNIIETYPDIMGEDMDKISEYSDALELYDELGYYHVKDRVIESLKAYQLTDDQINGSFQNLSGGQKRFAQLVQIEFSNADLLILDEPTNHMDYVAKGSFIEWLKGTRSAVFVISHDRDVLACVDRIIELKDKQLYSYPGDYEGYLKQNASGNVSVMHQYEVTMKTLENKRDSLKQALIKKDRSHQSPNPFIPLVRRLQREIEVLEKQAVKPTIWIDQDSMGGMKKSQTEQYDKYKAKNISLRGASHGAIGTTANLVDVTDLSLGYDKPLFENVSFQLRAGERLQIVGRNGAGKTTLVDALCAVVTNEGLDSTIYGGVIDPSPKLRVGRYEQELAGRYLDDTLSQAIAKVYHAVDRQVNEEVIAQLLNEFLFERHDGNTPVRQLSGGQKARLQLIALFAAKPNLLILDEPTNHLDLPSIEELENALKRYDGSILYISHDSYFAKNLGGEVVHIGR